MNDKKNDNRIIKMKLNKIESSEEGIEAELLVYSVCRYCGGAMYHSVDCPTVKEGIIWHT